MSTTDMKRVVTGKVRLSHVNVFSARAKNAGDDPKYSVTVLVPKSDFSTKQRIDAAINLAIQEGVTKRWNGIRPPMIPLPIHDGDGVRPSDGMPFAEECRGHWVFTASAKADQRPEVVDANGNPIMNQTEIYSGCFGRVSVRFDAYLYSGKKGIGAYLGNLQKLEDGPALSGGGRSAASDFGGGDAYAPPAPNYGQQQPAYQQQPNAYPPQQQAYQQPPAYQQQQPMYQQPPMQQPNYQQPMQQPNYAQQPLQQQPMNYPPQPVQIDPITGRPLVGGIMGL